MRIAIALEFLHTFTKQEHQGFFLAVLIVGNRFGIGIDNGFDNVFYKVGIVGNEEILLFCVYRGVDFGILKHGIENDFSIGSANFSFFDEQNQFAKFCAVKRKHSVWNLLNIEQTHNLTRHPVCGIFGGVTNR